MEDMCFKEKIWYYPYIKHDQVNERHMEILDWLKEQFNRDNKELWKIDWIKDSHIYGKYNIQNLYVFFKTREMAMAFKLRWC